MTEKNLKFNIENTLADIEISGYKQNTTLGTILYCRAIKQIHDAKKAGIYVENYSEKLNELGEKYNL